MTKYRILYFLTILFFFFFKHLRSLHHNRREEEEEEEEEEVVVVRIQINLRGRRGEERRVVCVLCVGCVFRNVSGF